MNIINRVIVDSTFGDRSFLLCKGDLLESSGRCHRHYYV